MQEFNNTVAKVQFTFGLDETKINEQIKKEAGEVIRPDGFTYY